MSISTIDSNKVILVIEPIGMGEGVAPQSDSFTRISYSHSHDRRCISFYATGLQ